MRATSGDGERSAHLSDLRMPLRFLSLLWHNSSSFAPRLP